MQSKHKSPGDGIRLKSVAIGLSSSRISPESTMRGHGTYNQDCRSFNRGFARGLPKSHTASAPQPSRKADILMEAGRLAAEYLVSQGCLSPNVLPNKLQNGKLPEFRGQDRQKLVPSSEGRASVLSRLGNFPVDSGPSRKKFVDEFALVGPRSSRAKRRSGSFRGHGSNWEGENEKTESWSGKSIYFSDVQENGGGSTCGRHGGRRGSFIPGSSTQRTATEDTPSNNETIGDPQSESGSLRFPADANCKDNSAGESDKILEKESEHTGSLDEDGQVNDKINNDEMGETCQSNTNSDKQTASLAVNKQDSLKGPNKETKSVEVDQVRKSSIHLLGFCSFKKFPTKARSSRTPKVPRVDQDSTTREKSKISCVTPARESVVCIEGGFTEDTSTNTLRNQLHAEQNPVPVNPQNSKSLVPELSDLRSRSSEEPADLDTIFVLERERSARSKSFSNHSSLGHEQELGQGALGFERSRSQVIPSAEKSLVQSVLVGVGGTKRPREWDSESGVYFRLSNVRANNAEPQDTDLPGHGMANAIDGGDLVEATLFPEARAQPNVETKEQKHQSPGSFKICDLNLTESCEMMDSPNDCDVDGTSAGSSSLRDQKEADLDVGLSISTKFTSSDGQGGCSKIPKEIVIVDVTDDDDDPVVENKLLDISTQKNYRPMTMYPPHLGNFLNHTENAVNLSSVPDRFGFGYSEFLGNDISNCDSISNNISNSQPNISLHNQEVIPGGEDDALFSSLEEIPLSFLGTWTPSNQDYGKSF